MKSAKDYLAEANAIITRIPSAEAVAKHTTGKGVWIDVRDSGDIAASGTIKGAERVARGFIEFAADPDMPFHKDFFQKDAEIYLICGAGGQAALAGKTLHDMGYANVTNVGGIGDWKDAGGPTEA
ncbi:MAG: rhodanese-like domain-containing protein [Yoonia sp.]